MAAVPDHLLSWRSLALQQLALRVKTVTGADGVAIALKAGNDIICEASVGAAPQVGSKVDRNSTWSARCLREAQPVSFSHAGENPHGSYSAVLAPILHCGRAIGFCGAFATRADAFTPRHVRMLTAIAQSAARAVAPAPRLIPPKTDLARRRMEQAAAPVISREVVQAAPKPGPPPLQSRIPQTQSATASAQPTQPASSLPIPAVSSESLPLPLSVSVPRTEDNVTVSALVEAEEVIPLPASPLTSEVWTDVEEQIAAFAVHQKRRARIVLAGRSAVAVLVLVALGACFYPDQIEAWAQPVVAKIQNSFQHSSPANEPIDISGKPSAAKANPSTK